MRRFTTGRSTPTKGAGGSALAKLETSRRRWHDDHDPAGDDHRPESAAEATTHLTYEIEEGEGEITTLTLIHDLEGAPGTAAMVGGAVEGAGGGWSYVLSDMKTLLETGRALEG